MSKDTSKPEVYFNFQIQKASINYEINWISRPQERYKLVKKFVHNSKHSIIIYIASVSFIYTDKNKKWLLLRNSHLLEVEYCFKRKKTEQ